MSINLNGKHHELIDMDEQNEEDSVSVVNVVKNAEIEVETRELTATPLKRYVMVVDSGANKWNALINMVLCEEWDKLKRGRSHSKMEHDEVRKAILDDDFWKNLRTTVTFMRLIWDMICYCDSDRACIGEVYQRIDDMLGSLNVALPDNAELRRVIQYLMFFFASPRRGPGWTIVLGRDGANSGDLVGYGGLRLGGEF
ncbi:hypothetical protein Vadar_007617 [Vaccinium darrowii]|uniref:Uncharacterized protein n=1 Tax=Vaccinium darrowii TaxID=229202 RepID=A0ACB7X8E1_9ERIC|nr:hypothetical protein Vadar_007617 [Vaccinium darrowii]